MVADDLEQQAITVLSTNLIISEKSARAILDSLTPGKDTQHRYALIVRYFPSVMIHHLNMFSKGEKLHRSNEEGMYAHYLNAFPSICVSDRVDGGESCRQYRSDFLKFYQAELFAAVESKLDILLFGMQALHQQISLDDFYGTFKVLQTLSAEGVAQLVDFSWHCKGHRISQIVDKVNFTTIYTPRCDHIPKEVQLTLANQTNFPEALINANTALEIDLRVNKTNRILILQQTISDSMKLIPKIAEILLDKAVLVKLTPLPILSTRSIKVALHYGTFPTPNEHSIDWARFMMQEQFSSRVTELFFSDEFVDILVNKLPTLECKDESNCFGIIRQDHNIKEYKKLLTAHTRNLTLPETNFYTAAQWSDSLPSMPSLPALPNMSLPSLGEYTWLGVVGASVALGACSYIYRSLNRHFGFWKSAKTIAPNTQQPHHKPTASQQPNYQYSRI
jgi:hypothetical protein